MKCRWAKRLFPNRMESDCRGFAGLENRSVEGVAFVKLELGWIVVKPPRNVVLAPLTLFERQERWERLINQHSGRVEATLEQEVVALTPTFYLPFSSSVPFSAMLRGKLEPSTGCLSYQWHCLVQAVLKGTTLLEFNFNLLCNDYS